MNKDRTPTVWIMATDREWTTEPGGPVDQALSTIAQLKGSFDAAMDFILVDTKNQGAAPNGQETATICFYVVVKDWHEQIEPRLSDIGLLKVEKEG